MCRILNHFRLECGATLKDLTVGARVFLPKQESAKDFDILIGHPLEKLFIETPSSRDLEVKLGRDTFSIPITRAKNSVLESLPYLDVPKEVMLVYILILLNRP